MLDSSYFFSVLNLWTVLMAVFAYLSADRRPLKLLAAVALGCAVVVLVTPFIGALNAVIGPMGLIALKVVALVAALLLLALTRSQDTRMIALLLAVAAGIALLLQVWTPRLLR